MKFLENAVEQNQRRMRIEDLILLALRCVLVALLAMALARPAIFSEASALFGQSKVTGVIILDNSRSMGMSDGTSTRFDKAKRAAEQALDSMPAGSATAIYLASDIVSEVIPEPTFDLNLARKVVRDAPLTDRASDLFPALQRAIAILDERIAIRREIYLITDGQGAGWRELTEAQRSLERVKTGIKTHLILVNEHEERNLALSELRLSSGLSPVGQPLRFEARVTNHGKEEARNTRVSLSINGEAPVDEFIIDSIPAGATRSLTMFTRLREEGFHSISARIPEDRLASDDRCTIAARAIREAKVLLVDGDPGNEPRDGEVFFLKNALVPVAPDSAADYFVKTFTTSTLELSQVRLDDFDCVILANVAQFSDGVLKNLQGFLRRGGGLIIFPGDRTEPAFYNERLLRTERILPAEFGAARGVANQDEKFITLQEKDYEHPIVALWNDPGSGKLSSARFFRHFELKMETPNTGEGASPNSLIPTPPEPGVANAGPPRIVVRYSDGTPAIVERTWGLGRVVLFSSTADTAWNDLPVRLGFVPLLHRVVGSVVSRQDEGLNLAVGAKFTRRVPVEMLDKEVAIQRPGVGDVLREVRRVEMVNGWPTIQYPQTDLAGLYSAHTGDSSFALKFATQAEAGESSLDELSETQLRTLGEVAHVIRWSPGFSLRGLVEKGRTGMEFWLPIVGICLILALLETFLAQLFSRSK